MRELPSYLREAGSAHQLEKARTVSLTRDALPRKAWPLIENWGPRYFYLYDTAHLITLHPAQVHGLQTALQLTKNNLLKYSTILWSWPKKSAKSTVIALVADWLAYHKPRAHIRLIANDLRQADSRVGMYMRENIKLGARYGYVDDPGGRMQMFRKETKIVPSGYTISYPNGSVIEMVPIDPSGEAGGNDDMTVFSELWGWKSKAHQNMWAEMTISPNRFGHAQRWVDTYAGFRNDSPILESMYDNVVLPEHLLPGEYEFYANGALFATWVTQPLMSWQTPEYYAQEEAALTEAQFLRMHRNQFTDMVDTFVYKLWWDNCLYDSEEGFPPLEHDELFISIDAGTNSDCFAMVAVSYNHALADTDDLSGVIVRYAKAWYPGSYATGEFDFEEAKVELDRLCDMYNVFQVSYDPWQMKYFASVAKKEGKSWYSEFNQGGERAIADKILYDVIRQKRLIHFGDADLTTHVLQSKKKEDKRGIRIIKGDSLTKKIDLTVALSMATKRCLDYNIDTY